MSNNTRISSIDPKVVKSLIRDKFVKYSKIGLFKKYSELLSSYNLEDISESKTL